MPLCVTYKHCVLLSGMFTQAGSCLVSPHCSFILFVYLIFYVLYYSKSYVYGNVRHMTCQFLYQYNILVRDHNKLHISQLYKQKEFVQWMFHQIILQLQFSPHPCQTLTQNPRMAASLLRGEHFHWNKYCGMITRYTSYLKDRYDV